jgi:uncharacterized oxidoreductase
VLGGALTGGPLQNGPRKSSAIVNSMFSIIVSPERLGTAAAFAPKLEEVVAWVQSETRDGRPAVRLPGEPERETRAARLQGGIPVDPNTWREVVQAAAQVGLSEADLSAVS